MGVPKDPPELNRVKPMYDRRTLVISLKDMEPTTFDSLRKAAKAINVTYGALRYGKDKERNEKWDKVAHLKCLSNFKERSYTLNTGVGSVPVDKPLTSRHMIWRWSFECIVSSVLNPQKSSKQIRKPNKAMMLREQQLNEVEKIQRVHDHH